MNVIFILSTLGCSALEMAQTWQLDRIRILGAKAVPAEPRPGDEVSFSSLVFTPHSEELESTIWFACLPEEADSFGCSIDPEMLNSLDSLPESPAEQIEFFQQLQEAGLIGIEPLFAPVWTVPEDALDGLDAEQLTEGVSAFVNITAIPTGDEDEREAEVSYRRIPISEATEPNHNPEIIDIQIDGVSYGSNEVFIASAGETYEVSPIFSSDSIEEYNYIGPTGEIESRVEEPYCTWYLEGGDFDQYYSLYPHASVGWTAPPAGHEGRVVVVVRDRRGGMDWGHISVRVTK